MADSKTSKTKKMSKSSLSNNQGNAIALLAVVFCFVLSGFAALLYQTAWLRQFSLVFGTSEIAVATVLAAYMAGLAAGAAIAGQYSSRIKRPVLVYGLLEMGIALSALSVPFLLFIARNFYTTFLGDQPNPPHGNEIGQTLFYLLTTFMVLALPTGFMGATLPLLTRHAVRNNDHLGPRVALLYGSNTLGAVIGTVVAAFILLPTFGLNGTILVGVSINAAVFVIASFLATRSKFNYELTQKDTQKPLGFYKQCVQPLFNPKLTAKTKLKNVFYSNDSWILPLILLSGSLSFVYEILWTRMLSHVLGGSIYAFATMLAAFLSGIAIGGGLSGKIGITRERAIIAFSFSQILVAILSIAVYRWMVPLIPSDSGNYQLALYASLVMLPATIFIGATLPLAIRVLAKTEKQVMPSTAITYTWNTVGAIIGAIFAGFYLIPNLGFEGTIRIAIICNFGLALWGFSTLSKPKLIYLGATGMLLVSAILFYNPSRPISVISSTGFIFDYLREPQEIYYGVGRSSTVLLVEEDGYYYLRTNGLPEASIAAKGSPPFQDPEKWLTALSVVARPQTTDMLVVGFGGGVALEGVPSSVERIDVIEIEPEVIEANRRLKGARNIDPLEDHRFNVIINDARNALRLTNKTYDAIISQPSHPWTAGASHLFTKEFIADAKTHLNNDGVFVQWMNSEFINEQLLRTLAATLLAEFENVRLYQPAAQVLIFLASDESLDLERHLISSGQPLTTDVMHYSRLGMNSVEDFIAALSMDEAGIRAFSHSAPLTTDNYNLMATHSNARANGLLLPELAQLMKPYDPLLQVDSWIHTDLRFEIDYGYLGRQILQLGQYERLESLIQTITDVSNQLELQGILYESSSDIELANQMYLRAIDANPRNIQARYNFVKNWLGIIGTEDIPEDIQRAADEITGSARAVIEGWAYSQNQDWQSLAGLDAELARTEITDAWYPESSQLRAGWRTMVSEDETNYAFNALRLLERAIVLEPDQRLHWLRMISAAKLDDDHKVLESARYITTLLSNNLTDSEEEEYNLSIQDLLLMRQNLLSIADILRSGLQIEEEERTSQLLARVNEIIDNIDEYPITN